MKNRFINRDQGITIVALIITIIVLIILATVSINALFKTNFTEMAMQGVENYAEAQAGEEMEMEKTATLLNSVIDKIIINNGNTSGNKERIEVEEKVIYNSKENISLEYKSFGSVDNTGNRAKIEENEYGIHLEINDTNTGWTFGAEVRFEVDLQEYDILKVEFKNVDSSNRCFQTFVGLLSDTNKYDKVEGVSSFGLEEKKDLYLDIRNAKNNLAIVGITTGDLAAVFTSNYQVSNTYTGTIDATISKISLLKIKNNSR